MVVDLPAPFGPNKPKISPRLICKSTPLTAVKSGLDSFLPKGHGLRLSAGAEVDSADLSPVPGRAGNFLTNWWASIAKSDMESLLYFKNLNIEINIIPIVFNIYNILQLIFKKVNSFIEIRNTKLIILIKTRLQRGG
jgi:hypothetical protein